jgi:hypothetical protein
LSRLPLFGRAVKNPSALLEPFEQACFPQELEMTADTRLALAENLSEFTDRQLGLTQQQEEPNPGCVPGCSKHADKLFSRVRHRGSRPFPEQSN